MSQLEQPPQELQSAPEVPAQARAELLALKSGTLFVCARRDGDIRATGASGEGLYGRDTRHLSELTLTVGGAVPVMLSSSMEGPNQAVINATNPNLDEVAQETINVRRTLLIADRFYYAIHLQSFGATPITTTVELTLSADFADVFEVRGVTRQTQGKILAPGRVADDLRFSYESEDGEQRETLVTITPAPARSALDERRAQLTWDVTLAHGEAVELLLTFDPVDQQVVGAPLGPTDAAALLARQTTVWERESARFTTDNELFDRYTDGSKRDVHALLMAAPGGVLPAAGIPWYVAPFGRDSLLTSLETLILNPEIARGTLLVLARLQATADEPWRDAEPGKILHELRTGELARLGHIPHTPYYGTADATPLFLVLAGEYFRWTLDLETMAMLRPAFDAALSWIDNWGDLDGDGFVEYERRSVAGLANQGWKDSYDSIVHLDGSLAEGPIALVEVQGYVYAGKQRIADVYAALGDHETAQRLRAEAAALRTRFNEVFWNPAENFFALALDGKKRQVQSVTSNPAHCLYCGIVDDDKARLIADRLMAPDMFSGWGVRTLSSESRAFNPMSYHNGSVWPHDNAIVAAGLKRYGFGAETARIAGAMFDVASDARDFRLPELFCGFHRDASHSIVAYPVACIPQAWAAAAPFKLLQSMLGLSADAPGNTLNLDRPTLPDWLTSLEVRDLRIGSSRVTLSFQRVDGGGTGFALLEHEGDVRVTMST